MQFKNLLFLAAAGLIKGFIIPEGLANGAYTIEVDENGEDVLKPIEGFDGTATLSRRDPLPAGELGCTGNGIDYNDLAIAQNQLYNYCGAGAQMHDRRVVFAHGGAHAYVCNYGGPNSCADHEAQAAFSSLQGHCGNRNSPVGGWYWLKDWAKTYGYDSAGAEICGNM